MNMTFVFYPISNFVKSLSLEMTIECVKSNFIIFMSDIEKLATSNLFCYEIHWHYY